MDSTDSSPSSRHFRVICSNTSSGLNVSASKLLSVVVVTTRLQNLQSIATDAQILLGSGISNSRLIIEILVLYAGAFCITPTQTSMQHIYRILQVPSLSFSWLYLVLYNSLLTNSEFTAGLKVGRKGYHPLKNSTLRGKFITAWVISMNYLKQARRPK